MQARPGACATYPDDVPVGARASTSRASTSTTSTENHLADLFTKAVNGVSGEKFLKKLGFKHVASSTKHKKVLGS